MSVPRPPVVTALVCGAALVVAGFEPLRRVLIYDRAAVEGGELWRLLTGSLVHYTPRHLLWNLAAVALAGTMIELLGLRRRFAALCVAAAATVGVTVHLADPALETYAGLSGVAVAAVVLLCLDGLRERGSWRWICLAALALLIAKLAVELSTGSSLLGGLSTPGFVLSPVSHAAGALAAAVLSATRRTPPAAAPAHRAPGGSRASARRAA